MMDASYAIAGAQPYEAFRAGKHWYGWWLYKGNKPNVQEVLD